MSQDSTGSDPSGSDRFWTRRKFLAVGAGAATATAGGINWYINRPPQNKSPRNRFSPSDGDSQDQFGTSVDLSEDGATALIGARFDEDPNGIVAGSAYVFSRAGGSFDQQAKLAADDGDKDDHFGQSVALSDDATTALIGAWRDEDPNGLSAGSAYVFSQTETGWVQSAKLYPENGVPSADFGREVALSSEGSTALVGAQYDDIDGKENSGAAYVFDRTDGSWRQAARLLPEDAKAYAYFGSGIDLSNDGTTALIGAPHEQAGSAYLFSRTDGSWSQSAKLVADDSGDHFGDAVGLSSNGRTALVGGGSTAFQFSRSTQSWERTAKLGPSTVCEFGYEIALSGDATVGITPGQIEESEGVMIDAAREVRQSDGEWTQSRILTAPDGRSYDSNRNSWDGFGSSVGISTDGTTVVVGANLDRDPINEGSSGGSAYVFDLTDRDS
jgi:hypothetical protein